MALRLRRGTDAERQTITPLQGELIFTTDTNKIYVGGAQLNQQTGLVEAVQGGILVGPVNQTEFDLVNDTTPQLGGNLDLNGNTITGVGNIDIDGTITATGNINLGDTTSDIINVPGVINSSLLPSVDSNKDLGSQSRRWRNLYATGISSDGAISAQSIIVSGDIVGGDSSLIYNSQTDTITATTVRGNFNGSLFADDSRLMIDGVNNSIYADYINTETLQTNIVFGTNPDNTNGTELYVPAGQGLNIIGFGGSAGNFQPLVPGDVMSSFAFSGMYANEVGEYKLGLGMFAQWDATADLNSNVPRANLSIAFGDNSSDPTPLVLISYKGNITASSFTTGSYSGSGNYPANPAAGTIVFDSSDNHFYGFNGTSWVQLDN